MENCFSPNNFDECGICGGNGTNCNQILGDINFDGIINILDVVQIIQYVLGNNVFSESQICLADYNDDNLVNILDIVQIVQTIVG